MLFKYNIKDKKFQSLQESSFSALNILERQGIEKWVEENPDIVGEELLIISTEYDKFDKTNERLDILALDKEGKIVVVELKRDDSGRNVELQAIKYAAYCSTLTLKDAVELRKAYLSKKGSAQSLEDVEKGLLDFIENDEFEEIDDRPRIILISREFRPEVTASVLWLRNFQLDISCVKITPYKMTDEEVGIFSQKIIPLPEAQDYQIQVERKESGEKSLKVSQQEYLRFWQQLRKKWAERSSHNLPEPRPKSVYQIPTGVGNVHFEWYFQGKGRRFGVELHFEKGSKEDNLWYLNGLKKFLPALEKEIGQPIEIMEGWGQKWARLYIQTQPVEVNEELMKYAVDKMLLFYAHLQPQLDILKNNYALQKK